VRHGGEDESVGQPQVDNLHLAFEDGDLVAQHQELGLSPPDRALGPGWPMNQILPLPGAAHR